MKIKGVIGILGCGWLGFPLAQSLISGGYLVKGTTTSQQKIQTLTAEGIDPYLVQFSASKPDPDLSGFLQADTLIVSVPPGRRNADGFENYRRMARHLCALLPDSGITRIIFISSTSVYADLNGIVNENSPLLPDTGSGKLLEEIEDLFSSLQMKVIILRLAGLIGPERFPGRFFAGKTNIPNGRAPINLIHLDDVIRLIHSIIENDQAHGVYNGCAPSHPTKEEFYTLAAKQAGLRVPEFLPEKITWKIITSERLESELNFKFKISSLMDWLSNRKMLYLFGILFALFRF